MSGDARPTGERLGEALPGLHRPARRPSILVVDDEPAITSFLRMGLDRSGYDVTVAADGPQALGAADSTHLDLVVLDLMLPGMDGVEVARRLRGNPELLILMLTAADAVDERIRGLDAGADDYLVKPFDFEELLARVRALLRRRLPAQQAILAAGPFVLDDTAATVSRDGEPVELTRREYDLFKLFLRHPRQVLTRDVIVDQVWGHTFYGDANVVDVYVRYLRNKLDPQRRYLQTVRGLGYRLMT
ncbi:MAG: response regulator transcription factor [Actinomycetota bacterium]|nr:response regulator transcription factor [Actinomycetota bacterium]